MKEVVRLEKNRGEPKKKVKRIPSKTMCKTTPKKELYIDYKGDFPLHNPKHEAFVINLLTMKQGEAYIRAGYNQTGENALKAGGNLLANNYEVSQRFQYLKKKHNEELEKKGLISREQMIANAIYAMNCSLGKLPIKKFVKYSEMTETVETFESRKKKRANSSTRKEKKIIVSLSLSTKMITTTMEM